MAGILKVDTIQNANADNIITQTNSTTLTIGASGDTVTLAAGATSSGFGATYNGAINWDTTAKTTGFTAVSGVGYFCNTTGGAFTVTLPLSPSVGAIIAVSDYAGTAATNNITIARNGSNIEGQTSNAIINTNRDSITLIYVDSTQGWLPVSDNTGAALLPQFVAATGGCIATCGNYKIHSFTGPGTFTITNAGNPLGSSTVDYLVLAGGGAGGTNHGGGGGAGGYRESVPSPAAWTASPLANPGGALPVSVQGYPITVGAGGAAGPSPSPGSTSGNPGNSSIFSSITSAGGAGGGSFLNRDGLNGGSGSGGSGGGSAQTPGPAVSPLGGGNKGLGNTPPVSPSQGNNGGCGSASPDAGNGGGGGGATVAGGNSSGTAVNAGVSGTGGNGATSSINGTPTARGGGGSGGRWGTGSVGAAGTGGGGTGGQTPATPAATGGTTNTGGGGGGGADGGGGGGAGGSGIVIIRYKFQ